MAQRATESDAFSRDQVESVVARARTATTQAAREQILEDLIAAYRKVATADPQAARRLRRVFLQVLERASKDPALARFGHFLVEEVEPEDLEVLQWQNPTEVIVFCELLYSFQMPDEAVASHVRSQVRHLLRRALHQFEARGEMEKMFQLLRMAPTTPDMSNDAELLRLRNRVYLHEMRRVRRNRRLLTAFLVIQLLLIAVVFPLLFINAENGAIQKAIEEAAEVDLEDDPALPQNLSFLDGVYWSLITASSIGYGDVTPRTTTGRIIAATLGVMGVITTGLLAGLILALVVPRSLD